MLATNAKAQAKTRAKAHAKHPTHQLVKEITELTKEVQKLKDLEFLRVFKNPWKFMWFSFLKGLMVGFGSVLGASVLVGFFIYLLAQISFVPILGDFVEDIMSQAQITNITSDNNGGESNIIRQYNENKKEITAPTAPTTP